MDMKSISRSTLVEVLPLLAAHSNRHDLFEKCGGITKVRQDFLDIIEVQVYLNIGNSTRFPLKRYIMSR